MNELDKKNCFHDIVDLYHKYALAYKRPLLLLGEWREILGEWGRGLDESVKIPG
jgi:hypothetical protein